MEISKADWKLYRERVSDCGKFISSGKEIREHPIKQKTVAQIVEQAKKDNTVKRIIVFGSSTRYDCDYTSDLDICIDWKENCYDRDGVLKPFTRNMRKQISTITKGCADVVNYDYLDGTVVEDAVKEGAVVYEYDI